MNTLEQSYAHCKEVMKEKAVSFYEAFKHLPRERFQGVWALYGFCRYVDDVTDEDEVEESKKKEALYALRKDVEALYERGDHEADYPFWPAFKDTIKSFNIEAQGFYMQLEGQASDLDFKDIETLENLLEYSRLVAGSVGLMMAPLLVKEGSLSEEVKQACTDLGIAMQLTNILRDVGEDLRERGRMYLPKSLLEEHGVKKEELLLLSKERIPTVPVSFILLWEKLSDISDDYYLSFFKEVKAFHEKALMPVIASALIYRGIASSVRKNHYNCLSKRNYTDTFTRLKLLGDAKRKATRITKND